MKNAILVEQDDIKQMLAEKYKVPISNIVRSQYSYTVILEEDNDKESNGEI